VQRCWNADPRTRLATAAVELERATAGAGLRFTIISRSTLHAQPGGPRIEVPDPADPYRVGGLADAYDLGGSIASGVATPQGFFLQMRRGPASPAEAPDFERAEPTLAALVRDGRQYRNDGDGWYETDQLPGIGLDPLTLARLPVLLREATEPAAAERVVIDGQALPAVSARGRVADAPGLMAIDAASFTELAGPIRFAFDAHGRLAQLEATMRNTNSEVFDLIVVTVITFEYPDTAPALPQPLPAAPPPTVPVADHSDAGQ
jgi:hypothetical protein